MRHVRGNHDAMRDPELARQGAPYAIALDGVTLAVLDTVGARVTSAVRSPPSSVGWLDDLAAARPDPVLVFAHHPVFNHDPSSGLTRTTTTRRCSPRSSRARREHRRVLRRAHAHQPRRARPARRATCRASRSRARKDYPGAWAEYRVYEGGYTQVMRRVSRARGPRVVGAGPRT